MEYKKLKEIALINPESIGKRYKYSNIRYLDTANIVKGIINEIVKLNIDEAPSRAKRIVKYNDIVYSTVRPNQLHYGIIKSEIENLIVSTGFVVIRAKNAIVEPDYLYAYLTLPQITEKMQSIAETTTSAYPSIRPNDIEELMIPLPSIAEQKKIANILSTIDLKSKINSQINDNLLKICNCIFHNYLDENETKIEYKKIIDIADCVITGKTPSTKNKELWKDEIPFITIPDMHNQVFTIETERKISRVGAKSIIPKDSISVSCIATVGLVSINTEDSQTNQQINSIVLKNEYDLYYLYEYLSEQEGFLKNIAGGSTTYNINKNMFENIEVPYLPIDKMKDFYNTVRQMFDSIKEKQLENKKLSIMRDTLLPKLMNGEIDLDKVQI